MERIYVGVPTKQEVKTQFDYVKKIVKNAKTIEEIRAIGIKYDMRIDVNFNEIEDYSGEVIEDVRYEYKNVMVYVHIENDKITINPYVQVFSDDWQQFSQELIKDYDKEVERVNKMGLLEKIK
jgi:hypothetical protein